MAADVTGLLIVAAAVTAVIGALLPASRNLPVLWLAPIALAVAAVVLLPEVFIQIPTTGDYSENFAFWSGSLGIAAFITLVVVAYWDHLGSSRNQTQHHPREGPVGQARLPPLMTGQRRIPQLRGIPRLRAPANEREAHDRYSALMAGRCCSWWLSP